MESPGGSGRLPASANEESQSRLWPARQKETGREALQLPGRLHGRTNLAPTIRSQRAGRAE